MLHAAAGGGTPGAYAPAIVLVDRSDGGHHRTHAVAVAAACMEMGWFVAVLHPAFDVVARELTARGYADRFLTERCDAYRGQPWSWRMREWLWPLQVWRHVAQQARAACDRRGWRLRHLHFLYLDDFLIGGDWRVRTLLPAVVRLPWSGLYFFPIHLRDPEGRQAWSARREQYLRARSCRGVGVLDEGIAGSLAVRTGNRIVAFPEIGDLTLPLVDPPICMAIRREAAGRTTIGVVGGLQQRKGLIEALRFAKSDPGRKYFLVIAGALGEAERKTYTVEQWCELEELLGVLRTQTHVTRRYFDDEQELNAIMACCDVVFAAYDNFPHSSGIVAKAAAFGRPVIVSDGACMAEVVRAHGLGAVVSDRTPVRLSEAIAQVLDARSGVFDRASAARYADMCSPAALREAMEALVGRPA